VENWYVNIDCADANTCTCSGARSMREATIYAKFNAAYDLARADYDNSLTPDFDEAEQRALYVQGWYYQNPMICELWLLCE